MIRPTYILGLLLTLAFTLATWLQPITRNWRTRSTEGGLMGMLFGDGRRMFANHFTAKADQYFHSGFYPSIFDQRNEPKETTAAGHAHDHEEETTAGHVHDDSCTHAHDPNGACANGCNHTQHGDHSVEQCEEKSGKWDLGHDWIATVSRSFRVTEHTHLEGNGSRELLPWLKISAELDPHQINTYLVGSYWLRKVEKSAEAEKFVRDGLEANPQNCELTFELGQIYLLDRKNPERAKNLFEIALRRWDVHEKNKEKPDLILLANIASHLARIEEEKGQFASAIEHLERARQASPQSAALGKQIEELKARLKAPPANPGSSQ